MTLEGRKPHQQQLVGVLPSGQPSQVDRGNVEGVWVDGEAKQLDEKESDRVRELFRKKYGLQYRLFGALSRLSGGHMDDSFVVGARMADA